MNILLHRRIFSKDQNLLVRVFINISNVFLLIIIFFVLYVHFISFFSNSCKCIINTFCRNIKCYSTYVGAKGYQKKDERFEKLREIGQEYGATTGRPRQIDWLNLDEVSTACQMNGITKLIVNKMDVLDQVNSGWNLYQDGILNCCADEGTFMLKIINHISRYNKDINIEFQGQLH